MNLTCVIRFRLAAAGMYFMNSGLKRINFPTLFGFFVLVLLTQQRISGGYTRDQKKNLRGYTNSDRTLGMSSKRQKQIRLSEEGWFFLNDCKELTGFTDTRVMEICLAMHSATLGREKKTCR